jgi:hypothetical protein
VLSDFPTSGYPPMIGRVLNTAEWLDYVAGYDFGTIPPTRLVLHHTYRPTAAQWRGLATMRGIQRYYAGLGWSAAPHIFVAPDGIWLFTPMRDVGIHAGIGNQGWSNGRWWYSIGLEMVGYFDYVLPDGAVWEHAKAVMGGLSRRLNIAPNQLISFHRDYTNQKSCPGWAVTKDWVFSGVAAWLNSNASPPPEIGEIGKPTPPDEIVLDRLLNESYERRSKGYNPGWAFHQYAAQQNIGMPFGPSKRVHVDGKDYSYQAFARDTLYSEVPNWGTVNQLSQLLGGSIPPSGLGRVLLEATYRDGGAIFREDWAFHQYALAANLGPPLGGSSIIVVDGVEYAFQAFARDTLYNQVPNWSDVQQLSRLANATSPQQVRLRDALLTQTYRRAGADYNPGWAFHQLARAWDLGVPLSSDYRIDIEGVPYNIQIYALDTLYNIVPHWQDVRRLSSLVGAQYGPAVLNGVSFPASLSEGVSEPSAPDVLSDMQDVQWEPPEQSPLPVLQYTSTPAPSAYSSRYGSRIALLVLHGDPGPARLTLEQMADIGAQHSTHYYITTEAIIYRLVADQHAAWHAGLTNWQGRRRNINRISIGIVLERPLEAPEDTYVMQRKALGWLAKNLITYYELPPASILRWRDLEPARLHPHSRQPLDDITPDTD